MKYAKLLGLGGAVTAALIMFTGTASATIATSPLGTLYTSTVAAVNENGHISGHGSNGITTECASAFSMKIESHGVAKTVEGNVATWTFTNCTNGNVVHVRNTGKLIFHGLGNGNATITSSGLTIEKTAWIFGMPLTCSYATENTDLGTVTGSSTTGGNATIDLSATIPRHGGSSLCGSSLVLTGFYRITTPASLIID